MPHSAPPDAREKLASLGAAKLSETELITLIIGSGSKRYPVGVVAKRVTQLLTTALPNPQQELNTTSFSNLLSELTNITGMGTAHSSQVIASLELGYRLFAAKPITTILTPQEALPHLAFLHKKRSEHCVALYLSARHELLQIQTISQGSVNTVSANPREVFVPALSLPCAGVIVAHNHPSGNPQPSQEDAIVTDHLKAAGELLGIPLNDHIIVAKQGWFSFAQEGVL
jgi:DNA repair protein RadC